MVCPLCRAVSNPIRWDWNLTPAFHLYGRSLNAPAAAPFDVGSEAIVAAACAEVSIPGATLNVPVDVVKAVVQVDVGLASPSGNVIAGGPQVLGAGIELESVA